MTYWNFKIKSNAWIILAVVLVVFFALLVLDVSGYKIKTEQTYLKGSVIGSQEDAAEQKYYFAKNPKLKPKLTAEAYVVGDLSTGKIILAKNQNKKFPIASVSKLMTALAYQSYNRTEEPITISKEALRTEGRNGDLTLNEKIKGADILYPLLLESSNDAAEAIAEHFGREEFIKQMNEQAKSLGLASTSFKDPSGLSPSNISTAFDLFNLANHLKAEQPNIFNLTKNKMYSDGKHYWFSNNQFLRKPGYDGGKSGYTDEALQTGVSMFSISLGNEELHPIAITLLKSKDRLKDVESIIAYLKKNIYYGKEKDANLAWRKAGTAEIAGLEPKSVSISFLGDLMLDRGVRSSVTKNFAGDYSVLFEKLGMLHDSDIVFGNLEGVASDAGKDGGSLYSFRMDPSVIPALKGAGFSVLSVANNHVGDWGYAAYVDTLARLKENEILYTGGGVNSTEAETPVIIERGGLKIGFLGFSDKGPEWMKATAESAGILSSYNPRFAEIIKNASSKVDFLIVSFHFGEEYKTIHDKRQELLAHTAIDNGAKIVVGHHPHVAQDTEVYRNGYIMYSLGNAIFDQGFSLNTMQGLMVNILLDEYGEMTVQKNIIKLNRVFQPDSVIPSKAEKLKFQPATILE